ncbi:MAG: threonine--tRNA ligase [Candidatus Pacearchaeota archaeon]|nr:threonine--tRNA ligase [Candidatus Pacearchaeota archaeon]
MKILCLHCDYIKFKALKKALKEPEEIDEKEKKGHEIKECLVVLTAVEKNDEGFEEEISKKLVENVKGIAEQVKCKKIVLYPYVHLTSHPSMPVSATKVLYLSSELLKKDKFDVYRAPFGWYKEFELKCKGHPLSELSRKIYANEQGTGESRLVMESKDTKELSEDERKRMLDQILKTRLDREKLKENDHRILGQKLDLFSFSEVAPGMVFWHNNGLIIYNELINYWREEHRKAGYEEISTPQILDKKLWLISGHWEKYRNNIFLTQYEDRQYAVKPMNCPGGILVFKNKPKSYKELPLRIGELGVVHRLELRGVLAGLFRVVKFTQDDAHIYCTEEQIEQEVMNIVNLVGRLYKKFGLTHRLELSTRPEKRIGSDKQWDKAEEILEKVLKKNKLDYKINKGDGAFYGPKIDFHLKDSLEREWQCATIQLDFAMPERFDLKYIDENNKEKRPVMLHRTALGALERFIGILLEHTNGNLPCWLSPIQVRVISFTDRNIKAVEKLKEQFQDENIRVDIDIKNETVNNKIRNAEMMHINYIVVIGDKEEKAKTLAIRPRGKKPEFGVKAEDFMEKIKKEIKERK